MSHLLKEMCKEYVYPLPLVHGGRHLQGAATAAKLATEAAPDDKAAGEAVAGVTSTDDTKRRPAKAAAAAFLAEGDDDEEDGPSPSVAAGEEAVAPAAPSPTSQVLDSFFDAVAKAVGGFCKIMCVNLARQRRMLCNLLKEEVLRLSIDAARVDAELWSLEEMQGRAGQSDGDAASAPAEDTNPRHFHSWMSLVVGHLSCLFLEYALPLNLLLPYEFCSTFWYLDHVRCLAGPWHMCERSLHSLGRFCFCFVFVWLTHHVALARFVASGVDRFMPS